MDQDLRNMLQTGGAKVKACLVHISQSLINQVINSRLNEIEYLLID